MFRRSGNRRFNRPGIRSVVRRYAPAVRVLRRAMRNRRTRNQRRAAYAAGAARMNRNVGRVPRQWRGRV